MWLSVRCDGDKSLFVRMRSANSTKEGKGKGDWRMGGEIEGLVNSLDGCNYKRYGLRSLVMEPISLLQKRQ